MLRGSVWVGLGLQSKLCAIARSQHSQLAVLMLAETIHPSWLPLWPRTELCKGSHTSFIICFRIIWIGVFSRKLKAEVMKTSHSRGQCSLPMRTENLLFVLLAISPRWNENTKRNKSIKLLQESSARLMLQNPLLNQAQNSGYCEQMHRKAGERKKESQCTGLLVAGWETWSSV